MILKWTIEMTSVMYVNAIILKKSNKRGGHARTYSVCPCLYMIRVCMYNYLDKCYLGQPFSFS